jgi:processive 1,2-diacylglycerol beta-glucosyltransferase
MRLLIISTSAGTGHVQAAAALDEAARGAQPGTEVLNVDALDHGTPLLWALYAGSYQLMANRFPAVWGFLYEQCETDTWTMRTLGLLDRHNSRALGSLVRRFEPDRIVCTHFLPASVLYGQCDAPLDLVVTDFDVHSFWIRRGVRRYYVATEDVRTILVERGVDPDIIRVSGIPISGRFACPPSREQARRDLGLAQDEPVLLAMGGGFGKRGLLDVVGAALDAGDTTGILAVAGRNEKMRAALLQRFGNDQRLRAFGFVRRIEVLMAAADIIITKPGGLTTAEALAVGRPMLLTAPVPGQEEQNARFLVGRGAAETAVTAKELVGEIRSLLTDPGKLRAMTDAARGAARPDAAARIIEEVLSPISTHGNS